MLKIELEDVRIDQTMPIYRTGSIMRGTIQSGVRVLEVAIEIDSPEPRERLAELVRVAREACFTHGALANPVEIETSLTLNGERYGPESQGP